ncbi:MAG: division/cell wall cluster transcriptional repressor MraZ [Pseudomonadota bacterium]
MFRGATHVSMDAKYRLAVPAKHRDALLTQSAGNLILTAHPHRCLLLYPQPAWAPIEAKINGLSSFNPQTSAYQRMMVGQAEDITLDGTGRLLVSPVLRSFAKLDKDVMFVGQGSHFEIWNLDAWHQQLETLMLGDGAEMPAELEGFSL